MKLERFIRDNREAFDSEEPSDELWNKIAQKLPQQEVKVVRIGSWQQINWRAAASILLALGLGYSAYRLNDQYQITEQPDIVLTSPSLAKQVSQYTDLVENKRVELRELTASDPKLYQQFAHELNELEKSYQNLKTDLPSNPNPETLIAAMIQNLQLQIEIQNQQLQIIQKIKQPKSHEKYRQNII